MQNFTNDLIDINNIPAYEEVPLQQINPKYKKVIFLTVATLAILSICVAVFVSLLIEQSILIAVLVGCGVLVFFALVLFLNIKALNFRGFAFREHDIISKDGIIYYTTSVIPNNRIQHIIIKQGLYSRLFKLCSLKIYTASVGNSDISVKGLDYQEAITYKEYILNKIKIETHD